MDEIYFNWRLELWAEGRGLTYNEAFTRRVLLVVAEDAMLPGQTYDYKDERLTFKIPEKEIINNPNLDD